MGQKNEMSARAVKSRERSTLFPAIALTPWGPDGRIALSQYADAGRGKYATTVVHLANLNEGIGKSDAFPAPMRMFL